MLLKGAKVFAEPVDDNPTRQARCLELAHRARFVSQGYWRIIYDNGEIELPILDDPVQPFRSPSALKMIVGFRNGFGSMRNERYKE